MPPAKDGIIRQELRLSRIPGLLQAALAISQTERMRRSAFTATAYNPPRAAHPLKKRPYMKKEFCDGVGQELHVDYDVQNARQN
jgi:hypothetical protein